MFKVIEHLGEKKEVYCRVYDPKTQMFDDIDDYEREYWIVRNEDLYGLNPRLQHRVLVIEEKDFRNARVVN